MIDYQSTYEQHPQAYKAESGQSEILYPPAVLLLAMQFASWRLSAM